MADPNPFDVFDAAPAQAAANPFDAFDEPAAAPRAQARSQNESDPFGGLGAIGDSLYEVGRQAFEALGGGEAQALREGLQTAQTARGQRPTVFPKQTEPYAQEFGWSDFTDPSQAVAKLSYGLGRAAPSIAAGVGGGLAASAPFGGPEEPLGAVAAIVGGGATSGLMSGAQALGPFYAEELKNTPNDPDGAFERAGIKAQDEGAISAATWAAFGIPVFKGPLKDLLFKAFVGVPGVTAAGREAANVREGKPLPEGVAEQVPGAIASTIVPLAGHHAIQALGARGETGGGSRGEPPPLDEPPPPGGSGPGEPPGPAWPDKWLDNQRQPVSPARQIGLHTPGELPPAPPEVIVPEPVAPRAARAPLPDVTELKPRTTEPNPFDVFDLSHAEELPPATRGTSARPAVIETPEDLTAATAHVRQPTPAQAEAGNYPKAHVNYAGLPVTIETPRGTARSGVGPDGEPWSVTMPVDYGYIKKTKATDGEQLDAYLGPNPQARQVYLIDQVEAGTSKFDEAKAMLGFDSEEQARTAYEASFSDGRGAERIGTMTPMSRDEFQQFVDRSSNRAVRAPAAEIARREPQRLAQFLRKLGGLRDSDGELKHMGAARVRGLVSDKGLTLDEAAQRAGDQGFLPERFDENGDLVRGDLNDLLEHLYDDLGGRPVYSAQDAARVTAFQRGRAKPKAQYVDEAPPFAQVRRPTLAEIHARSLAKTKPYEDRIARGERVVIEREGGRGKVLVSPEIGKPGQYRQTYFDASGEPTGHEVYRDAHEAARGLLPWLPKEDGPQTSLPGTEPISDRELAERRSGGRKGTEKPQKDTGDLPLFDSNAGKQKTLFKTDNAMPGDVIGIDAVPLTMKQHVKYRAIKREMEAISRRLNPRADLQPVGSIKFIDREGNIGGEADGAAQGSTIFVALEGNRAPLVTVRHEHVHVMRNMRLFRDREWKALEEAAHAGDWRGKHEIEKYYPEASEDVKTEEAIAQEFGEARQSGAPRPKFENIKNHLVRKLFQRMQSFLTQLGGAVRRIFGRKPTAEEVFDLMERGRMGERAEKGARDDVQAQVRPEDEDIVARLKASIDDPAAHQAAIDDIQKLPVDRAIAIAHDYAFTQAKSKKAAIEDIRRERIRQLRNRNEAAAVARATKNMDQFIGGSSTAPLEVSDYKVTGPVTKPKAQVRREPMAQMRREDTKDLYAVHNLTAANLMHADRMGGLSVPSLAIVRDAHGFNSFGEISLIAPKKMVDPKAGAKVFGADAYSPRYPTVRHRLNRKAFDRAWTDLDQASRDLGHRLSTELDQDTVSKEGLKAFENSTVAMLAYAREKGMDVTIPTREGYPNANELRPDYHAVRDQLRPQLENDPGFHRWIEDKFGKVVDSEHIFTGYDNQGRPHHIQHTLDNVVKIMKKGLRDGEGFNYGVGSIRSKVTPQFRSLKQLKEESGRIVDRPAFDALKKEIDNEFVALANQMQPLSKYHRGPRDAFGFLDAFSEHLKEIADRRNVKRVLDEYYDGVSDTEVKAIGDFMQKLRDLPTQYFEAKLPRAVQISEFKAAAVPDDTPQPILDTLKRHGITDIRKYKRNDEASRTAAINKPEDTLRFQMRREPEPEVPDNPRDATPEQVRSLGALVVAKPIEFMDTVVRDVQMWAAPMALGTPEARASAKDFANVMRLARWHAGQIIRDMTDRFTPVQLRAMWEAADEQSVAMQRGEATDGIGLSRLTPEERQTVEGTQRDAQDSWDAARQVGLVEGEGLPSYVPRVLAEMTDAGVTRLKTEGVPGDLHGMGANLRTSSPHMRERKYETVEETEAAARSKFDGNAHVIRDIRTLPLATLSLREAVAGRAFVNKIKEMGDLVADPTVSEGIEPQDGRRWFTIDHPSLKTWRPRLEKNEDTGKFEIVKDEAGNPVFDKVPIFVRADFEGPMRAILSMKSGALYNASMNLKGRAMTAIMYSPLIHNGVEWGRALPAMPGKVLTFRIYFEGNAARMGLPYRGALSHAARTLSGENARTPRDYSQMKQAILDGMAPIGHGGQFQDLTSEVTMPNMAPGRSITSKLLAAVPGLFDRVAGTSMSPAVKRAIDRVGDLWHNTLLWDRVADLQMGLYINLKNQKVRAGVDPVTAGRFAAHLANRYAGALPIEAMGKWSRQTANVMLFSRSFTVGNWGAMKDAFGQMAAIPWNAAAKAAGRPDLVANDLGGLPRDVQAQILRDAGADALRDIRSYATRKAMGIIAVDLVLGMAMTAIVFDAIQMLLNDASLSDEEREYVRRFDGLLQRTRESPAGWLNPMTQIESLFPQSENEPGKSDRTFIGFDENGTALYARVPTGKIGEEFAGWLSKPFEMLDRKLSTQIRPLKEIFDNDVGFGRHIYDPYDDTTPGNVKAIGQMLWHLTASQLPMPSIEAAANIMGAGDAPARPIDYFKTFGPLAGVTFSQGAPGGPAVGEMYRNQDKQRYLVQQALPGIRDQIRAGDTSGAVQKMTELNVPPGLIKYYIRTTLHPETRLNGRALRDFMRQAGDEEKARMARFRQQQSAQQTPGPNPFDAFGP